MKAQIIKFLKEEDGITALEYGILAALVAGVLVLTFKTGLEEVFAKVITALKDAIDDAVA